MDLWCSASYVLNPQGEVFFAAGFIANFRDSLAIVPVGFGLTQEPLLRVASGCRSASLVRLGDTPKR